MNSFLFIFIFLFLLNSFQLFLNMYKCINQPMLVKLEGHMGGQCVAPLTQHQAPFWGQSINNWRSYYHTAYFNLTRTIIVKKT